MRRTLLNLVAGAVVFTGGLILTSTQAMAGSCTGPAGSNSCICVSGDGLHTCRGDTCTSDETSCTYRDLKANQTRDTLRSAPDGL